MKKLWEWFNKQSIVVVYVFLFIVLMVFFLLPNRKNETEKVQEFESIQTSEDKSDSFEKKMVDSIISEDVGFFIDNARIIEMGCDQELMGDIPGKRVDECKDNDSFNAYFIGIIEGNGIPLTESSYKEFLTENFVEHDYQFLKKYEGNDFLNFSKDDEYGFIDKRQNRFMLVTISEDKKVTISYQDQKNLIEDYIK